MHSVLHRSEIEGIDFVPQAIFTLPLTHFVVDGAEISRGEDQLDIFLGLYFRIDEKLMVSLKHYEGFPKNTVSLYFPAELDDVDEITASIRRVMATFEVGSGDLHWERKDGIAAPAGGSGPGGPSAAAELGSLGSGAEDMRSRRILVTGGCGFIGSALVLHLVQDLGHEVLTLDALTYAANPISLKPLDGDPRHRLVQADICDPAGVHALYAEFRPDAVMHLAAESHVDRSITDPGAFVRTNVIGTQVMLDGARTYWEGLPEQARPAFRFLHVSTDEVYGSLPEGAFFTEDSRYDPRSPYSASKAASDHLARAWHETYGLPVLVTNCSNNYGPRHFPEKLIPLMILNALEGRPLPVYGDGLNERDWIHVEDHARGLVAVLERGRVGQTYLLGGRAVRNNLSTVKALCAAFDRLRPENAPHEKLISFVTDRPGHDRRYAIDCSRAEAELGWAPQKAFEQALEDTVRWYLDNEAWWRPIREGRYSGERLGLAPARRSA